MIKFHVQNNYGFNRVDIFAYGTDNGRNYGIELEQFKDGNLQVKRIDFKENEVADLKPVLRIANEFARELLPALQAALDNAGIEKPSESNALGRLVATERHLADLQKIVFKGR